MKAQYGLLSLAIAASTMLAAGGCTASNAPQSKSHAAPTGVARIIFKVDYAKAAVKADNKTIQQKTIVLLQKRANALGAANPTVEPDGEDRITVTLPSPANIAQLGEWARYLKRPGNLEFIYLKEVASAKNPSARYKMEILSGADGNEAYRFSDTQHKGRPLSAIEVRDLVIAKSPVILTGADLLPTAKVVSGGAATNPAVALELTPKGAKDLAGFTAAHQKEILAVVFDDALLAAPTVQEPITGGKLQIAGNKTMQEAQRLADTLNIGPLPAPLTLVKTQK